MRKLFSAFLILLLASPFLYWDSFKFKYLHSNPQRIRNNMEHVREKAEEIDNYRRKFGHYPSMEDLNCLDGLLSPLDDVLTSGKPCKNKGVLILWELRPEENNNFKLGHYSSGVMFSPPGLLGNINFLYDKNSDSFDRTYRDTFHKELIFASAHMLIDLIILAFFLSMVYWRSQKKIHTS